MCMYLIFNPITNILLGKDKEVAGGNELYHHYPPKSVNRRDEDQCPAELKSTCVKQRDPC